MAKKDYKTMAANIVKAAGGQKNIRTATHCMSRLRLNIVNDDNFDLSAMKEVEGVINVVIQNGEHQMVIGQDVPKLYAEVLKLDVSGGGSIDENLDAPASSGEKKSIVNTVFNFVGGIFAPCIPILIAGGLTGAVLSILTTFFGVSAESGTYQVLYSLNQATFYFLPVYLGFSTASRLKSNGYLGAFLGATLLYTTVNGIPTDFLGIPITEIGYNATVFPVILGCLFMSVVYRFFQNNLPTVLQTIFVPLLTMLVTVPVTLVALGPIGQWVGTALANGILAIYRIMPAVAVAIVGATTTWMVFFGMNNATFPVLFLLLAEIGSDPLICTGMAPANVAVGGACFAYALIAKKQTDKSVGLSAGITAISGITEPGVYGVLFPNKYPLWGAMIGGGLGGFIAGLFGFTQYVVANPGFLSFAAYINPDGTWTNFYGMMAVMVLAVVIGFGSTYILGKRALAKEEKEAKQTAVQAA